MKKFILSVLAIGLCAGTVVAQELSKEEQKAIKEQQKVITNVLKEAEKACKLPEDAMGQIDLAKAKAIDFDAARSLVQQALSNPQAGTMLGDIKRLAGLIEYNQSKTVLADAQNNDQTALNTLFSNCGKGFQYFQEAWEAFATPDAKGKVNTKFNDDMAAKAWELFSMSNGLANCGFTAYNQKDWSSAAKFFELASGGAESAILDYAAKKNPIVLAEIDKFKVDSVKYQNLLYAGSCYGEVDKLKAIEVFKQLIGKNTPQVPVFSSIVGEYAQLQDTTNMITWLQKGMEALPQENYFSNNLFSIYLDRNDLDGAINAMKASLANNPNNAGTLTIIARLYTQKGETETAKEYFEKALAIDPMNLDANLYYGYTWLVEMEQGESEMLKNHAREAEIDLFSKEKMDKALPLLRNAFKADANHENNDIPNLLMQVLYRKFAPTNAVNRQALINEYNEVADAYGRPRKE
jgi:tetratricopeptide (TPR) repeat protein